MGIFFLVGRRGGVVVITKSDFFFFFFWGGGSFLYNLGLFKVNIQNGNIFWAAKFQICLGMPDIPDFFFWGGVGDGGKQ